MPQNNPLQPAPARAGRQSGNAFMLVMIGVVLFGALMFTFSRGARQGDGNMSARRTEIAAADMLAYAQRVERGVSRILAGGNCSENFISFEHDQLPAMAANPDAPGTFTCHVFHKNGGNVTPLKPETFGVNGMAIVASGATAISGVGTHDPADATGHQDIVLWFTNIPQPLCTELNRRAGHNVPIPAVGDVPNWSFGPLQSSSHFGNGLLALGASVNGAPALCVNRNATATAGTIPQGYNFYYVLHAR